MTTTDNLLPVNLQPEGDICIPLIIPDDDEWLWLVAKCLSFPSAKRFWTKDEWDKIAIIRKEWEARVYLPFVKKLMEGERCAEVSAASCVDYLPSASFIDYEPMAYPFTGNIPSGYLQPPFFKFSEILPSLIPDFIEEWLIDASGWTGYDPTDILTATWAFPFVSNWFNNFGGGLPRFTVNVQGQGSVQLELISVPIGGRAIVAVDIIPNPIDILNGIISGDIFIVELERDYSSAPPETNVTNTVEIELTDDTPHFIHVTFVPTLNPDFIPLQFGGGLRKVTLCGVIPLSTGEIVDCEDILDCIELGDNETARYVKTAGLGLSAGVWTFMAWVEPTDTNETWEHELIQLVTDETQRVQWLGETPAKFHVSAGLQLGTNSAASHNLRLVHSDGTVLAQVIETGATVSMLNIDTDVPLAPNEYVYLQGMTSINGSVSVANYKPHLAIHRIDKTGATGAQGIQGNTGETGDSGTIPPEIEYIFINNMRNATDEWLDELSTPFDGSPQSIDPDIPAIAPNSEQEIALCKAISAWVNLYAENKLAQVRGASFIHQSWDAMFDAIQDAIGALDNVLGWSIGSAIFGCFVDLSSARVALESETARNDVICCLWGELNDIALTTGSFAGAIAACLSSLTGEAHDILCMIDNDLSTEHEVLFYYLYGRALEGNVASICPCGGFTYIEYDFTISNHGFTAVNGNYVAGVGWEGIEIDPDPDGVSRQDITIEKTFTGSLPKMHAFGYNIDAHTDCGLSSQGGTLLMDATPLWGAGIGGLSNGDNQFRTFTNGTSVPANAVVGNKVQFRFAGSACGGVPTALMRVKKVRLWLWDDSLLRGTPTDTTPQGLGANGTTDPQWWLP